MSSLFIYPKKHIKPFEIFTKKALKLFCYVILPVFITVEVMQNLVDLTQILAFCCVIVEYKL